MCCFTGRVHEVSSTNIYARALPNGRQMLAYGMTVGFDADVAMVLPLPVTRGAGEHALTFIDMSSAPKFFDDLDALYPKPPSSAGAWLAPAAIPPAKALVVHDVGDFEASFVPSLADFSRLDARFRLGDDVWRALPEYGDWGFAVFKLKRAGAARKVHPMAFDFPMRERDAVFFPTVHVHDGAVHDRAPFDHTLYFQPDPSWEAIVTAFRAPTPTSSMPAPSRAFVDDAAPVYRELHRGELPNDDIWMRGDVLRGRVFVGEEFVVRVSTGWDHLFGRGRGRPTGPEGLDPQVWREISTPESARVRARDVAGASFSAAVLARGKAWGLIPLRYDLPAVHPDAFLPGMFAPPAVPNGCTVTVFDYASRVRGIGVTLALRAIPTPQTMLEIKGALREAIARVNAG